MEVYVRRGLRPHCCQIHRAHMRPHASGSRVVPQNCHIYLAFDAHTLEKICENTHPTSTRPRARLLIRLTSTDLPSDQFSVFLLQKGVMMTNEPPQGCAAPQLPRLLRMIRPDRERLPERETEQCASVWMDAYIRPRRRATSSSRPSGHPEASCCRTATSTWPSMPTLEKICEKAHPTPTLLTSDFSVFLLQNGVMMTNARAAQKL